MKRYARVLASDASSGKAVGPSSLGGGSPGGGDPTIEGGAGDGTERAPQQSSRQGHKGAKGKRAAAAAGSDHRNYGAEWRRASDGEASGSNAEDAGPSASVRPVGSGQEEEGARGPMAVDVADAVNDGMPPPSGVAEPPRGAHSPARQETRERQARQQQPPPSSSRSRSNTKSRSRSRGRRGGRRAA